MLSSFSGCDAACLHVLSRPISVCQTLGLNDPSTRWLLASLQGSRFTACEIACFAHHAMIVPATEDGAGRLTACALAEHSVRRGSSHQRNSAMRRSSRRDAHMQARIAKLDTSNLSHYSLPTLQRLAKDMNLSNYSRLSKSELVVQLVAEIILANMSLGWSVPEVAHGHLDEEEGAAGDEVERSSRLARPARSHSPRSGSPGAGTVYRFGGSYDSVDERGGASDVEVEEEVSAETLQRGQDMFSRLQQWLPKFGGASAHSAGHESGRVPGHAAGPVKRPVLTGSGQVALGGDNVEQDFESLSALSMSQLQELCEDLGVEGWSRMRKHEMVGALLMDVYGLQH